MLIPGHKIEEVLERVDLVQLVSRHVELKKSGRSYKGRCPFHQEKSASFHVTPELRRFKCFGCQAGGDAIAFIQRYLGKTFVDAVQDLAREAGVDLESAQDPSALERRRLREVTDFAATHFQSRLWDAEKGKTARAYLASRGFSETTWRAQGLGYAPEGWTDLADALTQHGMVDWAVNAGLIAPRTRGEGFYDMFRGRLIIPIRSSDGRNIAFGARLLGNAEGPKYLNSKESRLYNKSETLYGLDLAREAIRKQKSAVLVEGYFDCIGLQQVGVAHTVALCSTALTPGHMNVLARADAKELVLLLDGDEAGRKAVERLAGALLASGMASKVAVLPEGDDPDTFAQRQGVNGVMELLRTAKPLTEHLFSTLLPAARAASFEEKMGALQRMKPIVGGLPVGLTRSALFSSMATHFGLPAAQLETELKGKRPTLQPAPKPGSPSSPPPVAAPRERAPDALESFFTALILKDSRLLALDGFRVHDELLHAGLRATIASASRGEGESSLEEASPLVKSALEGAFRLVPQDPGVAEKSFVATCRKLKLRRIDEQLAHIARLTGQTAGASDLNEETRRLQLERVELLALRRRVMQEGVAETIQPGTKGPSTLVGDRV